MVESLNNSTWRIRLKRGVVANLGTIGAVLAEGEPYYATDDKQLYVSGASDAYYYIGGAPRMIDLIDGATPALNAGVGDVFNLVAAGDRTIAAPTNPTLWQKIIIAHTASGANRTLSLTGGAGGFRFGSDITGLTATVVNKTDYIGCIYNFGGFWDVIAVVKGY